MSGSLAHAAFRLGFFIFFVSGVLLIFLESGTAEQAITLFTFVISVIFLAVVIILVQLGKRNP